jgi:hypothetical protein
MKAKVMIALSAIIFFIASIVYIFFRDEKLLILTGDISFILLALLTALIAVLTYFKIPREFVDERKSWLSISIAFLMFFFGEFFWGFYELVLKIESPSPSIADVAWHLGYLFLLIGLSYKLKQIFIESKRKKILSIIGIWLVLSLIYTFYALSKFDSPYAVQTIIDYAINLTYPIWDLLIVGFSFIFMLTILPHYNKLIKHYLFLMLGFFSFFIFDAIYAQKILFGVYTTGDYIDIIYLLAYLLIAYSAYIKYNAIQIYTSPVQELAKKGVGKKAK